MVHDDKITDSSKAEKRESLFEDFTKNCLRSGKLQFPTSVLKWSAIQGPGFEGSDFVEDTTIVADVSKKYRKIIGFPMLTQTDDIDERVGNKYDEVFSYYGKNIAANVCFEVGSAPKGCPPLLSLGEDRYATYDNSKESLADHLRKLETDDRKPRFVSLSFSKKRFKATRLSRRQLHVSSLFGMSVDRFNADEIEVNANAFKAMPAKIHDAVNIRGKQYCAELIELVNYDREGDFGNTPHSTAWKYGSKHWICYDRSVS